MEIGVILEHIGIRSGPGHGSTGFDFLFCPAHALRVVLSPNGRGTRMGCVIGWVNAMNTAIMSQGGRVVVPKEYRQKLGLKEGDEVIWTEVDGQLVLTSRRQQVERARQFFAGLFKDRPEHSIVDELIAERCAEAAREDAEAAESAARPGKAPA